MGCENVVGIQFPIGGPTQNLRRVDVNKKTTKKFHRIEEPILYQKLSEGKKNKKKGLYGSKGPILSQKLCEDQKKKNRTENKPLRETEVRMAFFVTNLSLLALQLGRGGGPPGSLPGYAHGCRVSLLYFTFR